MVNLPTPSSKLKGTDRKIISQGFSKHCSQPITTADTANKSGSTLKLEKVKTGFRKLDRMPF